MPHTQRPVLGLLHQPLYSVDLGFSVQTFLLSQYFTQLSFPVGVLHLLGKEAHGSGGRAQGHVISAKRGGVKAEGKRMFGPADWVLSFLRHGKVLSMGCVPVSGVSVCPWL